MAAMMEGFIDKVVQIVTNDGRNIVGVLKGFDQTTNVILDDCNERVYSSDAGVEQVPRPSCAFAPSAPRPLTCCGSLDRLRLGSTLCVEIICALLSVSMRCRAAHQCC